MSAELIVYLYDSYEYAKPPSTTSKAIGVWKRTVTDVGYGWAFDNTSPMWNDLASIAKSHCPPGMVFSGNWYYGKDGTNCFRDFFVAGPAYSIYAEFLEKSSVQGPQGPRGPAGSRGPQGPSGPQGPQGLKGDTGSQGPRGLKGDTGPRGEAGPVGAEGPEGPVGPKGDTGPAGPQGPKGADGHQGVDGKAGPRGVSFTVAKTLSTLGYNESQWRSYGADGTETWWPSSNASSFNPGDSIVVVGKVLDKDKLCHWYGTVLRVEGSNVYCTQSDFVMFGDRGPEGPQGNAGPQGIQGIPGEVGPVGTECP